jgi:hypothetical protein
MIGRELKERFVNEFAPAEKVFFLTRAREAAYMKGYRASEDLFHYCYFLTLRERIRGMRQPGGTGLSRFMFVEGMKDIEAGIRLYSERLEKHKSPEPDGLGEVFIEYLSG